MSCAHRLGWYSRQTWSVRFWWLAIWNRSLFLLLFAIDGTRVVIMYCILHTLWHFVVFVLLFTMNMVTAHLCIVIYNRSELRSDFVVILNSLWCYPTLLAVHIVATRDLKSQFSSHSILQWFQQYFKRAYCILQLFRMCAAKHRWYKMRRWM